MATKKKAVKRLKKAKKLEPTKALRQKVID